MKSPWLCHLRHAVAAYFAATTLMAAAQQQPYVLHVQGNEVVADLVAVDHNSYIPDQTLTAADISVLDDEQPVHLASFTSNRDKGALRPLAVWVITQCNLRHWDMTGSRFTQGRLAGMADGLQHLNPEDTVAAAGWCDDGRQQVGKSGHSPAVALEELGQWTAERDAPLFKTTRRNGEVALQTMLRSISTEVAGTIPRPLPVLVFLHQDDTGTRGEEYTSLLKILLEQSSIAYLVTDGKGTYRPSAEYLAGGNIAHILQAMSADTGGSAFVLSSLDEHPTALTDVAGTIIDRLHGRYQISFVPQQQNGKVHRLAVQLSDAGRAKHGGVLLQSRKSYLAPKPAR